LQIADGKLQMGNGMRMVAGKTMIPNLQFAFCNLQSASAIAFFAVILFYAS
jgi:hypothetical protein